MMPNLVTRKIMYPIIERSGTDCGVDLRTIAHHTASVPARCLAARTPYARMMYSMHTSKCAHVSSLPYRSTFLAQCVFHLVARATHACNIIRGNNHVLTVYISSGSEWRGSQCCRGGLRSFQGGRVDDQRDHHERYGRGLRHIF